MKPGHVHNTAGGIKGHVTRRGIHLSAAVFPIIYYWWGKQIAEWIHVPAPWIVVIIVSVIILIDLYRIYSGTTVYGQRAHESNQLSSFAWDAIGIGLVLLLAPGKQFGVPIIWGCAFGDPLVGEIKRFHWPVWVIFILGMIFISAIWLICSWWLDTPLWLAWLMGPITVLAEWPNIAWVDDNFTMQAIPLLVVLVFFGV